MHSLTSIYVSPLDELQQGAVNYQNINDKRDINPRTKEPFQSTKQLDINLQEEAHLKCKFLLYFCGTCQYYVPQLYDGFELSSSVVFTVGVMASSARNSF